MLFVKLKERNKKRKISNNDDRWWRRRREWIQCEQWACSGYWVYLVLCALSYVHVARIRTQNSIVHHILSVANSFYDTYNYNARTHISFKMTNGFERKNAWRAPIVCRLVCLFIEWMRKVRAPSRTHTGLHFIKIGIYIPFRIHSIWSFINCTAQAHTHFACWWAFHRSNAQCCRKKVIIYE